MSQFRRIHLQPDDVHLDIAHGRTLLFGLADHGIFLRSDCGGLGNCKKCRVAVEVDGKTAEYIESCSFRVTENLTVRLPASARLPSFSLDKAPLLLPKSFSTGQPDNAETSGYGVAIDLGTTTIGLYLCHMEKRQVLASLAVKNPQSIYGDDVMNRISAIAAAGGKTAELQRPVLSLIDLAIYRLCSTACIDAAALTELVVAGNPTMIHIFLGENPETIGISPYQPLFTEARRVSAGDLGITSCRGRVQTLPLVSGFIGADTLAAALAIGIKEQPVGTLLVDLGTNGELLLVGEHAIYATSCATGPAFEGASLSCGMQAGNGAIDRVEIDSSAAAPRCRVVVPRNGRGAERPAGLCGSGIVSAIAACLRTGIIETSGVFNKSIDGNSIIRDNHNRISYQLVPANDSQTDCAIVISQKDIRAVQLGKAALRAGIDQLLFAAGLEKPTKILVAGAFGSHIEASDMIALGMLPDIGKSRIFPVGNAAGAGTVMALCDPASLQLAGELAAVIKTNDLAANPDFQKVFIDCLKFPSPIDRHEKQ
jgi:uncharacterized 2Fe-2S/4Fe-4S cluster protein (DUF4445 family)